MKLLSECFPSSPLLDLPNISMVNPEESANLGLDSVALAGRHVALQSQVWEGYQQLVRL